MGDATISDLYNYIDRQQKDFKSYKNLQNKLMKKVIDEKEKYYKELIEKLENNCSELKKKEQNNQIVFNSYKQSNEYKLNNTIDRIKELYVFSANTTNITDLQNKINEIYRNVKPYTTADIISKPVINFNIKPEKEKKSEEIPKLENDDNIKKIDINNTMIDNVNKTDNTNNTNNTNMTMGIKRNKKNSNNSIKDDLTKNNDFEADLAEAISISKSEQIDNFEADLAEATFLNEAAQINIDNSIKNKLLVYQIPHIQNLLRVLQDKHACLDASQTGVGKTYCAIAIAKQLGLQPFIVCPKSIIPIWNKVAKYYGVDPYAVVNYETLLHCKIYDKKTGNRVQCEYMKIIKEKIADEKIRIVKGAIKQKNEIKIKYVWKNLPKNIFFIFDEAHKCKNAKTYAAAIIRSVTKLDNKILMLSATISDTPYNFQVCGYVLNLYGDLNFAPSWFRRHGIRYITDCNITDKNEFKHESIKINKEIFPYYGARIRIADLGDLFPENQVSADCYDMGDEVTAQIIAEYREIEKALEELQNKDVSDNPLVRILRARQKIELLKVSTFVDLCNEYLENNLSIVIFVNFQKTLDTLATELDTDCVIHGKQDLETRQQNIDNFQDNNKNIIICNINAGGVGVSLHDISDDGSHPRVSLISPPWSGIVLKQALGRIHRAGSKSKALQRIIFASNTVEEAMCEKVKMKLDNINCINDGDLANCNEIENLEELLKKDDV